MRMFGRPTGWPGRLGGAIMARGNRAMAESTARLLAVRPGEAVLEIGFGPGVGITILSRLAGRVAGVDPSAEMLAQARSRNAAAIDAGAVDLRLGTADRLPFDDDSFDAAMAINSMQVWPDPVAGLHEIRRVMRSGGRLALGFTPQSRQPRDGLVATLASAGLARPRLVEVAQGFCALASKD